jgi:hypothetical protein
MVQTNFRNYPIFSIALLRVPEIQQGLVTDAGTVRFKKHCPVAPPVAGFTKVKAWQLVSAEQPARQDSGFASARCA